MSSIENKEIDITRRTNKSKLLRALEGFHEFQCCCKNVVKVKY